MPLEIWLPAYGYEDFYEVSNLGRARRIACVSPSGRKLPARLLKVHIQRYNAAGYLKSFVCFGAQKGGRKSDSVSIGRLVLLTFKGPPPSLDLNNTRHLDDNIANNKLTNLAWGTHKQNVQDAIRNDRRMTYGIAVKTAKLSEQDVKEIRARFKTHCRKNGARALALEFGVHEATVSNVVKGKSWNRSAYD